MDRVERAQCPCCLWSIRVEAGVLVEHWHWTLGGEHRRCVGDQAIRSHVTVPSVTTPPIAGSVGIVAPDVPDTFTT